MKEFVSSQLYRIRSVLLLVSFLGLSVPALGQAPPGIDRRPQATRAQLDSTLVEIDKILASPAYSEDLKQQKRAEAAMIRERLTEGDFRVGDQLSLSLSIPIQPGGQPINNQIVTVGPNQMLQLTDIPEIPLRGILRSELQAYLTEQLKKQFKDQTVQVVPTIRLTVLGGVPQPGFYQLAADMPLPDVIMKVGGPTQQTKLEESVIRRGAEILWDEEQVAAAIQAGTTLDQLNLRAGDELVIGMEDNKDWFQTLRTYALIPGLILSLAALGKLFGII